MSLDRLVAILPARLGSRLAPGSTLRRILANISWLLTGRVLRLALGLVVGALVARHLGPSDFGVLGYARSLVDFAGTFVYLGLAALVVKDLVERPDEESRIVGSVFFLRLVAAVAAYAVLVLVASWSSGTAAEKAVILVFGLTVLLHPFQAIDLWFQARTQARSSVVPRMVANVAASLARVAAVLLSASVVTFAAIMTGEILLASSLVVVAYGRAGGRVAAWRPSLSRMRSLFSRSAVLLLSSFLAMVYLKVDALMLRWLRGTDELGVYAAAVQCSEVWYFIPGMVAVSVMPTLVELRSRDRSRYDHRVQQTLDLFVLAALAVALPMTFVATPFVTLVFGPAYEAAGPVLALHVWAGVFVFLHALSFRWFVMEGLLWFPVAANAVGAVVNVGLNALLIGPHGGMGAAAATLVSYALAFYGALFFSARTRGLALQMSKALVVPLRLLLRGRSTPVEMLRFLVKVARTDWRQWARRVEAASVESGRTRPGLALDCLVATFRHELLPQDFFKFGFGVRTSLDERRRWLGTAFFSRCLPLLNRPDTEAVFRDKGLFRKQFARFRLPAGVAVRGPADAAALTAFLDGRPGSVVVVKPLTGSEGRGVSLQAVDSVEGARDAILAADLPVLVEERLQNHPDLARISPTALSTVRVLSFLHRNGEVEILVARVRFALDGVVDNMASGGVAASVDPSSGVVDGLAVGYHPVSHGPYERHPRTLVPIVGSTVPDWPEALATVDAAARVVPGARLIGWDLAMTASGVVLLEGNWASAPTIWQLPGGQGMRPVFDRLLAEMDEP